MGGEKLLRRHWFDWAPRKIRGLKLKISPSFGITLGVTRVRWAELASEHALNAPIDADSGRELVLLLSDHAHVDDPEKRI